MANIPLRAYEKKIEELIEQNHLPEAVAHCRHILKSYPKNISTYRILGKAFLEAKQYTETADVFKRVLTVFPDDFISHVGMSIIRENENNLDAAIWHMELAFDSQPSNIAIQEELKRLFGRRDGTHPTKIRLTRGALVRMYARGELYQQAIAEINSALSEDIKRLDLEVFLAKMLFLSGDQNAAIELCQKLAKEIPYCFDVNKVLFDTSPAASQADKNNVYAGRLQELDPYFAFVNPKFPSVDDIPDDKVMIDELSDSSLADATRDSSWISNLENSWDKPSFVPEPQTTTPGPQTPSLDTNLAPALNAADLFGEDKEPSLESIFETPKAEETQPIESVQSNDWLHDLNSSKPESSPSENRGSADQPTEVPDWLSSLVPEDASASQATNPPVEPASAFFEPEGSSDEKDTFASSGVGAFEYESTPPEEKTTEPEDNADLPDWLKNFDTEKTAEPVSQDDLPDWLNSLQVPGGKPANTESAASAFEVPDEIPNAAASSAAIFSEEPAAPAVSQPKIDTEISSLSLEESQEQSQVEEESLPAETVSVQEETNEVPDWIRKLHEKPEASEAQQSASESEPMPESIASESVVESFIPEPIEQAAPKPEGETLSTDQTISDQTSDELLEWLRDLKPEDSESLQAEGEMAQEGAGNTDSLAYDFDAELSKLNQPEEILPQATTQESIPGQEMSLPEDDTDDFLNRLAGVQPQAEPIEEFEALVVEPSFESPVKEQPSAEEVPAASSFLDQFLQSSSEPSIDEEPAAPEVTPSSPAATPLPSDGDIQQLLSTTQNKPDDYISWQKLGDAYANTGRYTDALFAYSKAEQILINLI
jgi:tetratricopeptide (TPR) repeat protein